MSYKKNIVIVFGVVGLAAAGMELSSQMMSPDPTRFEQYRQEQAWNDLSDEQDRTNGRHEDEADDLSKAENDRKNIPGEHKPNKPPGLPGWWW